MNPVQNTDLYVKIRILYENFVRAFFLIQKRIKTVPYGLSSEIWFEFSEPKIDAYGLSSEKKT